MTGSIVTVPEFARSRWLSFLAIVLAVYGCGDESPSSQPGSTSTVSAETGLSQMKVFKEVYDVEYADGVAVVDDAAMAFLESTDNGLLNFAEAARPSLQLAVGQVVVFSGYSVGRVVSVDDSAAGITVTTAPALFTDAFKNADIEVEVRIDWRTPPALARSRGFELIPSAYAEGDWSIAKKFELRGVSVDTKLKVNSADRLEFEINAGLSKAARMQSFTRGEAQSSTNLQSVTANDVLDPATLVGWTDGASADSGAEAPSGSAGTEVAKVRATGHISGFVQALRINVRDSTLREFDFRIRDLEGEIRVEGAGLEGTAGSFDARIPLEYVIPIVVGPVPLALKLGAAIKLTPQVHAGSAKFCFVASYKGTSGVSFVSGTLKNESIVGHKTVNLCGNEETVSAGPITVAFGATANIPEISLLIFGNTIVPSIALNYGGLTAYEPGIASARQACQSGNTDLQAIVKIALSFFGAEIEREARLWQQKKEWKCDGSTTETRFDPVNGEHTESRPAGG